MWFSVAKFELKYQLTSPTFWVSFIIFLLLGFGIIAAPNVQLVGGGNVFKNAPIAIVYIIFVMTVFFMFVTTAFGANVIIRDQESGFGPLIYSTRISKSDYVFGRTIGAFLVCALAFAAVPLGVFIGTWMPWIDADTIGPNHWSSYAYAYFLIGLPSVLFMVALFSTAATLTRSMMGSYLCAVGLFLLYTALGYIADKSDLMRLVYAWVEPFGSGAIEKVTRYWTPAEDNTALPPFTGIILFNRALYTALGIGLIVLTRTLLRFDTMSGKKQKLQKAEASAATASAPPQVQPTFGMNTAWATLVVRTRFEVAQVFTGAVFPILMLLAMAFTVLTTMAVSQLFGTDVYPVTRIMISPQVASGFILFTLIVAIFYSGELVWRERSARISEIIDATAMPNWAYIIPKTVALMIILLSTLMISMFTDMAVQAFKGYYNFEIGKYLLWYVLPFTFQFLLLAVLSIFIQALSPNKFVGWAIMVAYYIAEIVASQFGFDHKLYMYNAAPFIQLSDMNGMGQFWIGWLWFKLYWTAFAVMLLVISHVLWRRGAAPNLWKRLGSMPRRLKGIAGVILALSFAAFAGLGAFIFYNTNVLNTYLTKTQLEKKEVAYEKAYAPYVGKPQPSVVDVKLNIDLYPHQLRFVSKGVYTLKNETAGPISEIYTESPHHLAYSAFTIDGAKLKSTSDDKAVRIYSLAVPMAVGETRKLSFNGEFAQKGFSNDGVTTRIVDNGTFINNWEFAPRIGIADAQAMTDKSQRHKYGLPPLQRMKKLEDASADTRNYIGADWTTSDITVSTVADQTPIAPGYRVSDVTTAGRRTSRFVSTVPILNFFSVQSAHYMEKHLMHDGVDLVVYYDAQHPYNVDGMLHTMATALDYYQANFSPYQFKQARILEFPAYASFAQSFANTIPFSEGIGFIADVRDPDKIDYTAYVTAHELGHQWWAHQIVGADKQGATSLSETLAQYSALMVMEKLYGPDKIRRFLKFELNTYLVGRVTDPIGELPLERVENQQYIHYNKGSLVMYLLKDRLGEAKVNAALRTLLHDHAFKGAPYPRSTDLVNALRAQASPQDQALITDLFEKITLVDLRATDAKVAKRPDGKFDVTFTVEAHKYYAEGKGKQTEAPLNEPIDIGLFTAKPGEGKFGSADVIQFGRQPIHTGKQQMHFTVSKAPVFVGVDPYNKWIDRVSDDNVVKVGE